MTLLSCHGPGTPEKEGGLDFILRDLRCRLSTAQRREAAVASGVDRILFFLTEGTIWFDRNFNRLRAIPNTKIAPVASTIIFLENNLHCHLL